MNDQISKLQLVIENYKNNLNRYKDDIDLDDPTYSTQYNKIRANENEILESEKRLGCRLPNELREFYLNSANGTEKNIEEYGSSKDCFDIFSHQKIFGIVDFASHYWEQMGISESPFEYNTSILEKLSDEEQTRLKTYNKEFFVCVVDWDENFVTTFIFDKKRKFYIFYFDQDETIGDYITELLDGSIHKSYSLSMLVDNHLKEKIQNFKEEFEH